MERWKFSREFKLEAVKPVVERGVGFAQGARDLDLHANVLRKWVGEQAAEACDALRVDRSLYHYKSKRGEQADLRQRIKQICGTRVRHGYEGGYDAARHYARGWRREQVSSSSAAFVPLSFAPGEAYQFDWSHDVVLINGVKRSAKIVRERPTTRADDRSSSPRPGGLPLAQGPGNRSPFNLPFSRFPLEPSTGAGLSRRQEPIFVPRSPTAPEGDGYVTALQNRLVDYATDLVVLDA